MKNKVLSLFILISVLPAFSQKITIINKTLESVTVKIQNEVTFDFDRLTLGPNCTVDFESTTQRRVALADTIHFFAINELKKGNTVITIYQLSAKTKKSSGTSWDEDEEAESVTVAADDYVSDEVFDANMEETPSENEAYVNEVVEIPEEEAAVMENETSDEEKLTGLQSVPMVSDELPAEKSENSLDLELSDFYDNPDAAEEIPEQIFEDADDEELKIF